VHNWGGVSQYGTGNAHPTPWIIDIQSPTRILYEAHHYWDSDGSGDYPDSYATEVALAAAAGFTAVPEGADEPYGNLYSDI
ncbi:hypothetical protein, partial [Bacillus subtilis]|uniref:hypothetical protein n=1 Tax=Bacillus subtilis TaxID=1423 RepID=UPI003C13A2E4